MKENKNIERLFQEKFKDFEAMPPLESWSVIEARLNEKKKKRRVIPLWFKPVGIAASLILGFFLFINKANNSNAIIVNDSSVTTNSSSISNIEENKEVRNNNSQADQDKIIRDNNLLNERLENASSSVVLNNSNSNQDKKPAYNKTNYNKGIVSNKNQKTNKSSVKNGQKSNNIINSQFKKDDIVNNNKSQKKSRFNNEELIFNDDSSIKNKLVINSKDENNSPIDNSKIELLNSNTLQNSNVLNSENSSGVEEIDSLFIQNEIIIANAIEDSILLASNIIEENPLEKLLKEKLEGEDADEKEKEKRNKWAVSTVASPVYFNSVSNGSSLDSKFENNSKEYVNSLSFGVGLEYEVSKKWSLRTGVNTLSLNYNTNDVVFFQDVNAKLMQNVTPSQSGLMLSIQSKNATTSNSINLSGTIVDKFDGQINQRMGFIEVPLEMSYKLLDKKFGINVIGGMSTLFLNENRISLESNGSVLNIGQANNLNDIHFSSNVGLGFKYTFWKSFQANFQPMFKYQINTFSNDSGNFKPYFVGLYSGVSFSF
jgi:hypothetical protein